MAIPVNITKESIFDAANYIKKNGIPDKNKSIKYELVLDSGERYPPKYIIAIADYLINNSDVSTKEYNAVEAKSYLEGLKFVIETKQEKFELVITDDNMLSTEENFTTDNIGLGDNYKPLDVYFKKSSGEVFRRKYNKGERRNSNQTMPRLAFQIFERSILALVAEEKENFPVCQYTPNSEVIRGIFTSVEEFKKHRNTIEYLTYTYDSGKQFVIYSWNIFSTIFFVQECLKRFGEEGDQFILTYREKDKKESIQPENEEIIAEEQVMELKGYMNPYSNDLIESKNIIFRGAPGTGKSYLAKEIAADIISNGYLMIIHY